MTDTDTQNRIKTERLILTPLDRCDVNRYVEMAKNMRQAKKENSAYFLYVRFENKVKDLNKAVTELITSVEQLKFPEMAKRFNICLKNGYIIGYIGFLHNPRQKISSDLGIFLDPAYEHKGYAFEAQKSLLAYYFINHDDKIFLTIHPDNLPSYRLNTKCGAVKVDHSETSKYGAERDILVITREKFIEQVFQKKVKTTEEAKQVLKDYLKIANSA